MKGRLSVTSHINYLVASLPDKHRLSHDMCLYPMKLKRHKSIPGLRPLISSLPGSASRRHVESLGEPRDLASVLKALLGNLDIKRHSPGILYRTVLQLIVIITHGKIAQ